MTDIDAGIQAKIVIVKVILIKSGIGYRGKCTMKEMVKKRTQLMNKHYRRLDMYHSRLEKI